MKANASGGGGKKPAAKKITRTGKVVTKTTTKKPVKLNLTGSSPTLWQGQAATYAKKRGSKITYKAPAEGRAMVASMIVPGGAAIKGASAAAKLTSRIGRSVAAGRKYGYGATASAKSAVHLNKADRLTRKAQKVEATRSTKVNWGDPKQGAKMNKEVEARFAKASGLRSKAYKSYRKAAVTLDKAQAKSTNKAAMQKLKNSGAIKRMK